jgi:hypothetical protein
MVPASPMLYRWDETETVHFVMVGSALEIVDQLGEESQLPSRLDGWLVNFLPVSRVDGEKERI